MKLIELVNLYDSFSEDIADNYIDTVITIDWEKESTSLDKEYPYLMKATKRLMAITEIEKINGSVIICKFSKIIDDNIQLFKGFIENNWVDSMQWVLDEDAIKHGEFHYEILKDLNNVVIGNYGESVNKKYYQLLSKCKIK